MVAQRVIQPVSELLDSGSCEPFKAGVHGVALALAATCALYNTAAWIKRRQSHLAINAVLYWSMTAWEHCHVMHHLRACAPRVVPSAEPSDSLIDAA
jgi:hypothetical protein